MSGSAVYQGMRWFKCDLHVHSPEDGRHWNDATLRLPSPRDEQDLQAKARLFLQKCHELGLECLAVVDHNFSAATDPRCWFLTHLIEQNQTVAKAEGRSPLVIFPGFELDIRYHVLCLFNPATKGSKLEKLSDILTGMGLPCNERFVDGIPQQPKQQARCWSLREILDRVQNDLCGIVIAAHAFSDDGICNDTANIRDFVDNPDLYAVEVNSWPPAQKIKAILAGSNPRWQRAKPHRQPAAICGSDGKSLADSAGTNGLGCRFSWIKMSHPSIESLRQAFLDPASRICLDSEPPRVTHSHIKSVQVVGTRFLKDQTFVLTPHLNCIIGGRGSGKSMLFESMRLGLRGEIPFKDVSEKEHVAVDQIKRLRSTFRRDTRIELRVWHDDLEDTFVVDNSGTPARVENREVADAATVFRRLDTLIFSQEEITQLSKPNRQTSLLDFVDNLAGDRLEEQRNRARAIIEQLRISRQLDLKIQRLDEELIILKQEGEELGRELAAKTTVQEELKKHRAAQEAKRYIEGLAVKAEEVRDRLTAIAEELETEPPPLGSRVQDFPREAFFRQAEEKISQTYLELAGSLKALCEALVAKVAEATTRHAAWPSVREAIEKAEEDFHAACNDKGLTVDEAERLRETEQQYRVKIAACQAKQAERDRAAKEHPDADKLFGELAACWLAETQTRREVLDEITKSDTMPRTERGEPIVRTSLDFAGDRRRFQKLWGELSPARNTRAGRLWDIDARDGEYGNIGDALFDAFLGSVSDSEKDERVGNPIQWLETQWDGEAGWPSLLLEYRDDIDRVRREKTEKWFELMVTRIPDAADLTLLRTNGTEAGSFQRDDLSTGQKNTAVLSLLLARGTGPVLIDQPEDQLDSEFLYMELVPMFRAAKQQRQLIIVTHNANIPVNADAEMVYALRAEGGRGVCLTQGGLDRPKVTKAVLDIMEGSEEAFRRRQEKYHF